MNRSLIQLLIILMVMSTSAVAQLYDVQISVTPKKIDQQKSRKESMPPLQPRKWLTSLR